MYGSRTRRRATGSGRYERLVEPLAKPVSLRAGEPEGIDQGRDGLPSGTTAAPLLDVPDRGETHPGDVGELALGQRARLSMPTEQITC